eukprot:m.96761 g.96761  ORF g.96761 m.96761 type:complete len:208 (+) comp8643_c0_seq5:85-708(+)
MVSKLASTAAVDRFLHRKLPEDQYRSLRAVEPCVVSCTPDARAVKFVALSDDGLYVCENPPRKVQLLLVYSDISQVEVVHDIPKFLQHEVGEKVVHLRLHKGRMAERASRADLSPNPSPRNIQRGFNALSVSPQPVRAPSPLSGEPHSPKALNPLSRVYLPYTLLITAGHELGLTQVRLTQHADARICADRPQAALLGQCRPRSAVP